MGYCKNCIYYTQAGNSSFDNWRNTFSSAGNEIGFCLAMVDSYGNPQKVRGLDSCRHFEERLTSSNSGYTKGGGCFLTSACVDYLGKADDCYELTVLRKFRDDYMKSTEEGRQLVEKYYEVAPGIVEKIYASDKPEEFFDYIYTVITDCINDIENDDNESALSRYRNMVETLQRRLSV